MQYQQIQRQFIAHIKDPVNTALPAGIDSQRMAVYTDLFFNNIQGFVASAFPVLKSLYSFERWQALVRQFFVRQQCSSPYFLHIAEHFLQFLQQDYQLQQDDPCFMLELAHYEWAELYLATKQLNQPEGMNVARQVADDALQLSQLCMLLASPYALHEITADNKPETPGEMRYYLLYRDIADEVKFMLINPLTAALLQNLQLAPGCTVQKLVQQLSPQIPQYSFAQLMQGACGILQEFAAKGVVVSFQAGQNSLP